MEKYCRTRLTTDDSILQHMHCACWMSKAAYTHSEYVIYLLLFHDNDGYMNVPKFYIMCTLRALFVLLSLRIENSF